MIQLQTGREVSLFHLATRRRHRSQTLLFSLPKPTTENGNVILETTQTTPTQRNGPTLPILRTPTTRTSSPLNHLVGNGRPCLFLEKCTTYVLERDNCDRFCFVSLLFLSVLLWLVEPADVGGGIGFAQDPIPLTLWPSFSALLPGLHHTVLH